jgi:hypothetical protein
MKSFKFEMEALVALSLSGEQGVVTGRCEYLTSENSYLVRYLDKSGCQKQSWLDESALIAR